MTEASAIAGLYGLWNRGENHSLLRLIQPSRMTASQQRMALAYCLAAVLAVQIALAARFVVPPSQLGSAPYADWAHHHWVWLDNDNSNQTTVLQNVMDYLAWDIPVGAVDVDSGWETDFNTFVFDNTKFPDPQAMVDQLHSMNVRIIFWILSFIGTQTSLWEEAASNDYLIKNALKKPAVFHYWHGNGSLLDFTNPAAVQWYQGLVDPVLALGIDGWKTDGSDPFLLEAIWPYGYGDKIVSHEEYANGYYGFFLNYTREKNGDDRLIMARPVDGFDPVWLQFAPRYAVFSGWVGDQDPTFDGLQQALLRLLQSAWDGYVGFGSDIGGYRSGKGPGPCRTKELFTRWFQLGAFCSLMENGGKCEHQPWYYNNPGQNDTSDTYRVFVNAHMELVSYLLSAGTEAFENGGSIMLPLAPNNTTQEKLRNAYDPPTYDYLLGPDIYVSPIMSNDTEVTVTFPAGSDWVSYWNTSQVFAGNTSLTYDCPLASFPVFSRAGAIIPLNVTNDRVGHGDASSAGALTLFIAYPQLGEVSKRVRRFKDTALETTYVYDGERLHFTASAQSVPVMLMIVGTKATTSFSAEQLMSTGVSSSFRWTSSKSELSDPAAPAVYYCERTQALFVRPIHQELGIDLKLNGLASYRQ